MFKLSLLLAVLALSASAQRDAFTTTSPYMTTGARQTTSAAHTTAAASTEPVTSTAATSPAATTTYQPTSSASAPTATTAAAQPASSEAPTITTTAPVSSAAQSTMAYTTSAAPTTSQPESSSAEPVSTTTVYQSTSSVVTQRRRAPCSSRYFSLMGKCGGPEHAHLRCPKGYWCSQWGYCGTTKEYRVNALCPRERRENPAVNATQYSFAPDDQPTDYMIQDDMEALAYDKNKTSKNCRTPKFHRWGKCGTTAHGHFRCKYGEWCSKWGYCSKYAGAAKDALCPREPRLHPKSIMYEPTPDDDPKYVELIPTTFRRSTTAKSNQ